MVRQRFLLPEFGMQELLISGCTDSEYSYDAEIDGRYNGAMSAMAIRVIRQNPGLTYSQFYSRPAGISALLRYPQSPQLEGSDAHKGTLLFEPVYIQSRIRDQHQLLNRHRLPEPAPGCVPGLDDAGKKALKDG